MFLFGLRFNFYLTGFKLAITGSFIALKIHLNQSHQINCNDTIKKKKNNIFIHVKIKIIRLG